MNMHKIIGNMAPMLGLGTPSLLEEREKLLNLLNKIPKEGWVLDGTGVGINNIEFRFKLDDVNNPPLSLMQFFYNKVDLNFNMRHSRWYDTNYYYFEIWPRGERIWYENKNPI